MEKPKKLINRNFFLLWQGQAVSNLGTQVFSIALILWIVDATGSTTLMGLIAMISSIPALLLGPVGGTFADRHSRKRIIVFSDIFSGIIMILLASLAFYFPAQKEFVIVGLFIASTFVAIVNSFFFPAISAAIPDLVPDEKLTGANTLSRSSLQISQLIGEGLGGVFYSLLGAPMIFLINGISYLFSATSESFIAIPQKVIQKKSGWKQRFADFKQELIEGFRYIWNQSGLRELMLASAIINFFTVPIIILLPFFVEKYLNLNSDYRTWFGILLATYSIGSILGYIFAGANKFSGKVRGKIMIIFIILSAVAHSILGVIDTISQTLILVFIAGFMSGFISVNITTILQWTTPSEIRGRVFGVLTTVVGAVTPIAMGLSGIVADLMNQNIPLIFIYCGIIMAVLTLLVTINKNYRAYLSYEPASTEQKKSELNVPITEIVT